MNIGTLLQQLRILFLRQEGQDLVEYALVVALIALAATAGLNSLATSISTAFTSLSTSLNSSV